VVGGRCERSILPLLLSVGSGGVTVYMASQSVTERMVPLPARWLKEFGEVQALARGMRLADEVAGVEALIHPARRKRRARGSSTSGRPASW
jgi:hypothetical protein